MWGSLLKRQYHLVAILVLGRKKVESIPSPEMSEGGSDCAEFDHEDIFTSKL